MVATKLEASPALLEIAIANIARLSERQLLGKQHSQNQQYSISNSRSQSYLEEWMRILAEPLPQIIEYLISEDEHMCALRQCSPFAGVLTPQERWKVYASY
jgi:hypothetical protein